MSFSYPRHCTYCTAKVGSKHCVLPWNLVLEFNPPTDELSRTIELSELHAAYGIRNLQHNMQFFYEVANRPTQDEIRAYSESLSSRINRWESSNSNDSPNHNNGIKIVNESQNVEPVQPLIQNTTTEVTAMSPMPIQHDDSAAPSTTMSEVLQGIPNSIDKLQLSPSKVNDSPKSVSDVQTVKSANQSSLPIELEDDESYSIAEDISIAIICAFNLDAKHRYEHTVTSFHQCMAQEVQSVFSYGEKYIKKGITSLDHPISLSKEICSVYQPTDLYSWNSEGFVQKSNFALLNHRAFLKTSNAAQSTSLISALLTFFQNVLIKDTLGVQTRDLISRHAFSILRNREISDAYQWARANCLKAKTFNDLMKMKLTQQKSSSYSRPFPESNFSFKESNSQKKVISQSKLEKSQMVKSIIENDLAGIVSNTLHNNQNIKFKEIRPLENVQSTVISLIKQLVDTNKGWENPLSFRSTSSVSKLSESLGLDIPDEDLSSLHEIFRSSMHDLISKLKK